MADLALSNVSNRNVESLTQSEYRRVAIGVQLVRDPVVLGRNSIALLKSQQTFQQSFYRSVGHPVVLELLKSLLKSLLRFQQSY